MIRKVMAMLKTLRHGDDDCLVRAAKLLTGYCVLNGGDDRFNAEFVSYILAWQNHHGLTADGIVGAKTWQKIAEEQPICSTSKNRTSAITQGLQLILDGNLIADGIYGDRTKAAVEAFQSASGHLKPDGICGSLTWKTLITGDVVKAEGFKQPIDYKQYDSRWAAKMYSNHNDSGQTMRNSGCGPTAAADIVATLKDPAVTPYDLAKLSMEWGTRTYSSGTAWDFFGKLAKHYGFSKFIQTASLETLKACLDAGGYAVCSMAPGYWTKGGHFICAWKYDDKDIYCNDPASAKRTHQNQTDFMKQRKQFFCFYA